VARTLIREPPADVTEPISGVPAAGSGQAGEEPLAPAGPSSRSRYDREIVTGPLLPAVWRLAWPTMLQNMIGGMQGIVDHVMVGHYVGFEGNAAIGVSWQIYLVVVVFISSLFMGMSVLVARFAGAGEHDKVDRTVYQAFLLAAGLSLGVLAPVGYLLAPRLLVLVNAAPEVQLQALPYLRVMFVFSIPAFGTTGAAMGTVIASGGVGAFALWRLARGGWVVRFPRGGWRGPDRKIIRELFRFGLPAGIQGIAMNIGGLILLAFIGSLPESAAAQAAYAVCYTELFSFITWTSMGLRGAAAAVAGQNLGAGRPDRSAAAVHVAGRIGIGAAVAVGACFLFLPRELLGLFGLDQPDVVHLGVQLLHVLSVSALFIATALTYTGGLQGTGDTKSPLYISIVSQLVVPLGLCVVLQELGTLSAMDIWVAILVGHITRCVLSVGRFQQGKWRTIAVDIGG
jgi:Na+-driven multidrug efflux pump